MMQRWEYMTWVLGYADTEGNIHQWQGGVIKYVNGQPVENWREAPRLPVQLQQAGQEGWELVTASYPAGYEGRSSDPLYIFKRPAQ